MSKAVELLFLSQEDVIAAGGMDIKSVIDAEVKAYSMLDAGQAQDPVAPQIHFEDDQAKRIMAIHPSWLAGDINVAGMKLGARAPENPRKLGLPSITSVIELIDPMTGHPFCIMDGTFLTAMRTGATTGVALRYLGRKDYKTAALLGAGVMGRAQAMAIAAELPNLSDVRVFDINRQKAEAWVAEMKPMTGLPMRVVGSAEEAIRGADLVAPTTLVSVRDSYIQADWIKAGALLTNISDNDYTFGAVQKAHKIVIDGPKQFGIPVTLGEMVKAGLLKPENTLRIGAIINGKAPGRQRDDEIIFFSALGMGIHDLMVGYTVYQRAKAKGIGTRLKLWENPYWV
jgi:ornithine cyclodeaminase/alanine dehydrogenase-like protein (mu-crystallin family)